MTDEYNKMNFVTEEFDSDLKILLKNPKNITWGRTVIKLELKDFCGIKGGYKNEHKIHAI